MNTLEFEEFTKIDIRIGKVVKAEKVSSSKKLMHMEIDIGGNIRHCVAGIAEHYTPENLLGKKIAIVTNLKPRKMLGYESQVMILAAVDQDIVSILGPDKDVAVGSKET